MNLTVVQKLTAHDSKTIKKNRMIEHQRERKRKSLERACKKKSGRLKR